MHFSLGKIGLLLRRLPRLLVKFAATWALNFWQPCLDHAETGEKGQNVISSSVQHPISLIFAIHVSFIIPLPMMWVLLTKPMQKSVITVCLHCSFARLKNKHMGVLGTNVATMSWLHWSPVLGIVCS